LGGVLPSDSCEIKAKHVAEGADWEGISSSSTSDETFLYFVPAKRKCLCCGEFSFRIIVICVISATAPSRHAARRAKPKVSADGSKNRKPKLLP
jgi:hypothetical protein